MAATKRPPAAKTSSPSKRPAAKAAKKTASKGSPITKPGGSASDVAAFFASLDDTTRVDCAAIAAWMKAATRDPGVMYGSAIVGYGTTTIQYAGGREAPWMKMGISPRKAALTLYGLLATAPAPLLGKLGKYTTGKGCLYIKRLADVDAKVLQALIAHAAKKREKG